jgi:predicted amidohydrolase
MTVRVAIAQLSIKVIPDAAEARDRVVAAAEDALRETGAQIVVLPELALPGYTTEREELADVAASVPGPVTAALADVARGTKSVIVAGLAESAGDAVFNTAVAVSGKGILLHYRKLHLFDREKAVFTAGDLGLPVADTPFGRIGLCVCYDLRFPEVARVLALRGAELICVPTAWVWGFDPTHGVVPAQVLGVTVQANLNQAFLACASHVGQPDSLRVLGRSVVADPFGELVLGPLSADEASVAVVDIDLGRCRDAQRRSAFITPREDRRTDVYGIAYGGRRL